MAGRLKTQQTLIPRTGNAILDVALRDIYNNIADRPSATSFGDDDGTGTITASKVEWYPGGSSDNNIISFAVDKTTIDATATDLYQQTLRDNCATKITVIIMATRRSTGDVYTDEQTVTYKRRNGGAPSIVGAIGTGTSAKDAGASTWALTFDIVNTNDIRLKITGQSSATIKWSAEIRIGEQVF